VETDRAVSEAAEPTALAALAAMTADSAVVGRGAERMVGVWGSGGEVKGVAFLAMVLEGLAGETDLEASAEELGGAREEGGTAVARAELVGEGRVAAEVKVEGLDRAAAEVAATADYKSRRT